MRPARRAADYPFGAAAGSFALGGGLDPLPSAPPLLAYGANRSPERLAGKLPGVRVVALAGRLRGWAIVHSAHVSPYGSVPATLVPQPSAVADVHVLLLGDRAALDATEPNYRVERLTDVDLEVDRLGRVDAVDAYVSRWGALLDGGRPVGLGTRSQAQLRAILSRSSWRAV